MVYRRASPPDGLQRLTSTSIYNNSAPPGTSKYSSNKSFDDPVALMAQYKTRDLETGSDRTENGKGAERRSGVWGRVERWLRVFGRPCRSSDRNWRWTAVVTLQAMTIVALLLRMGRDEGAEGNIEMMPSTAGHIGPRVEFVDQEAATQLTHLIMVPGHGVTMTESLDGVDVRDDPWFLLGYQKEKDVPSALVGHIRGGLNELDADDASLLLFSGGKTRVVAGPKSEGESYFFVADHFDWWGKPDLRARASTEDFARDSFENILFSICRFKEITGNYPTKITIVGYDFKAPRFEDLHRAALHLPREAFRYIGLHPGGRFDHAAAEAGERSSALEPYRLDPYGCAAGGQLAEKRAERNPFHRTPPYVLVCPELRELLAWCGPGHFEGELPWLPGGDGEGRGEEEGDGGSVEEQPRD